MQVIDFEDHVAQELARASFVPQRHSLRWTTGALTCLAGLALLLAFSTGLNAWPALVLGSLALFSGIGLAYFERRYWKQATLRGQLEAGLRGQQRMGSLLNRLDDRYYMLNNLKLPGRADDIDHVVVGPTGIFALETKNHRGRIFLRDGQWYQAKVSRRGRPQPEETIRDPMQQLKRNVDYLRSCINRTDPDLSRRTRLWIEGVVVFTHPAVSLDLPQAIEETFPFPAMRARYLSSRILRNVPRRPYSKAEVRQIVSMFGHLQAPYSSPTGHGR